jgi:hypothetical protein
VINVLILIAYVIVPALIGVVGGTLFGLALADHSRSRLFARMDQLGRYLSGRPT